MKLKRLYQNIDWSKPYIKYSDLDLATYRQKFVMWDYVLNNNLLSSPDPAVMYSAYNLLNDDTIYAYHNMTDENGNPFKFTVYQDAIGNLHHDFSPNNPNRYIIYRSANQMGKSALLINKAIKLATTEENKNIVMVSKSLPQSTFLLAQLKQQLNNSVFANSWKEDIGDKANATILTFKREIKDEKGNVVRSIMNRIICAPAGLGILGYPVHYLFLDEADFYENAKQFFYGPAKARLNKTKGQCIIFTNPNFEINRAESLLYELWEGSLFTRKFHFRFLDAPWNTKEEYDKDKRNTPEYIFASTHDGDFSDLGGAWLTYKEIQDMLVKDWDNRLPVADRPVYIGLDLGKVKDQSVICVGIKKEPVNKDDKFPDLDVKYVEGIPLKTDYDKVVERVQYIKDYYDTNHHGVAAFGYDATGQETFTDLLKKMNVTGFPVDYSKKETNKTKLFNDLKLMIEKRKIKVVYDSKMEKQLAGLEFKQTETKKLSKVENKSDTIHDDYPNSLAILTHVAVYPHTVTPTIRLI